MTTDLEQLLRSTLDNRAATVTSGPQWTAWTPPHRRRPPTWVAGLAAAATVAAIAVAVATVSGGDGTSSPATQPPTTSTRAPTPTPRTSSSVPALPAPAGKTCTTTLPSTWTDALRGSGVDLDADQVQALSVGTDGTIVALRDAGPRPGTAREVVLLPPDGGAPRTVYRVSDPDRYSVQTAQVYDHWLMVAVTSDPRPPANTVPGSSPMPNVRQVLAVDLTDEHVTTIATGIASPHIDYAILLDGRVYWDERARYGAPVATVRSYGLKTGDHRTEFSGVAQDLRFTSAGIYNGSTVIASVVPAPVSAAVHGDVQRVVTDGSAFAWGDGQRRIGWWQPGMSTPRYRTVPLSALDYDNNSTGGLSVSGHYVLLGPIVAAVLDMRTGAIAPITGSGIYGGHGRGQFDLYQGGGVAAGAAYFGTGHYVSGYWTDGSRQLLRVDLDSLPDLTC